MPPPTPTTHTEPRLDRPLRFAPQLQERVWGGRKLAEYGKVLPGDSRPYGESWEVSDVPGHVSVVAVGPHAGRSLHELVESAPDQLLGRTTVDRDGRFPLLLKLLDAAERLSVQLHPADADLQRQGVAGAGKTEAWMVLDAEPDARIIHGLQDGVSSHSLYERLRALDGRELPAAESGDYWRWFSVERGDVVFVPAGTVHAIGGGIVLLEVQQTSDSTYRIHDWGRMGLDGHPRPLHLLEASRVAAPPPVPCPYVRVSATCGEPIQKLISAPEFEIELLRPAGDGLALSTKDDAGARMQILAGFNGTVELEAAPPATKLECGDFALLPAAMGDYRLSSASSHDAARPEGEGLSAACWRFSVPLQPASSLVP